MSEVELHLGDCLDVMRGMEADSVDSVICDPPYGLGKQPDMAEVLTHWLNGDEYEEASKGFMGKSWDSFVPGPNYWREVIRVIKPGGMCLVFGGTRTADLLSIALRLAGFEIRDTLMWLYGSG